MELTALIDRAAGIRQKIAIPTKQRLAETAQALSLAADNQARIELLTESIMALTSQLYHTDNDQRPANVDPVTWRLLIPAPWGRSGRKQWGLRFWEGEILSKIMLVRAEQRRPAPLFDYGQESRRWHINLGSYPTIDSAFGYLRSYPITLAEWHRHADIYRQQASDRMHRHRAQR